MPRLILIALILVTGAFGTGLAMGDPPARPSQADTNPLEGIKWYVDPQSESMNQWRAYMRAGDRGKADLIWRIAREPKNVWVGSFTRPNFHVKVRRIFAAAHAQDAVPFLTVLRAESTSCSPAYDGGGPAEDRRTMDWYENLARAIGNDRVVIAFEPDSVGTIDCHAKSRQDDRIRVLRHGVETLAKLPNATIYLEGGASDWEPADRTARTLRRIGIAQVRGFMLNATHYDWTRANIQHGLEISRLTGGKHFVINTAENGRGPVHVRAGNGRRITIWCNPGLRGLGPSPTTETSHPKVDAYLWINRPGYAQSCMGQPIKWFVPRALTYARYATNWESPPPGTHFGHRNRPSRRALNIP